jgi:hypothetical protein
MVNSLNSRHKKQGTQIVENDCPLDDRDACERFANFFDKKVSDLCGNFQDRPCELIPDNLRITISCEILDRVISKTKSKKSCGPDGVPMRVMKDAYPIYREQILSLFNKIIDEGSIPKIWKTAIVTPVHKKGSKESVCNYQPVSGFRTISKLFERCLLGLMDCWDLEGSHQHGFKADHSTVTAMIEIQSIIAKNLDQGKKVLV